MRTDNSNPYVGLRAFEVDESMLFFGRGDQTLELLQRLHQHHFVAVVGSSGSGKSSLLRAGLIPALTAGYLVDDSDHWLIAIMKPGQSPLYNLADALLHQLRPEANATEVDLLVQQIKEEGADVILNLLTPARKEKNINFFLLVDQFEEIFRFAMEQKDVGKKDEAIDFVHIMLELAQQQQIPVYVVMTMRSDFIGDCVQFNGLAEAMNQSQYLVPKINRVQLRIVIEGPAKLYGCKTNPSLTSRLLNDLGKVKDELPLLQHALMRIWYFEMEVNKSGEIDLEDYESIGGIEKALSNHADEALAGLGIDEQLLAKKIFQALTEIDTGGRKIRRPVLLSQLKELTGANEQQLLTIINGFIENNRSFLVINTEGSSGDKVIDISHESLIRQWNTLNGWVDEEGEASAGYLQLAEATRLYQQHKKDFLYGSELQIALDWFNKFKPSAAWANRYKPGFNDSIDYLNASAAERSRLLMVEKARRRKLRYLTFFIMGILLIASIGGVVLTKNANKLKELAMQSEELARESEKQARQFAQRDSISAKAAKESEKAAKESEARALASDSLTKVALVQARNATYSANVQKQKALELAVEAQRQESIANDAKNSLESKQKELLAQSDAFKLHIEATKTLDKDPKEALRFETEALNKDTNNYFRKYADEIYATNSFYKEKIDLGIKNNSAIFSPGGDSVFIFSKDGRYLYDLKGNIPRYFKSPIEKVSADGRAILTTSNSGTILYDLKGNLIKNFGAYKPSSIALSPDGKKILTYVGDTIALWNLPNNQKEEIAVDTGVISFLFSPGGEKMLTSSDDTIVTLRSLVNMSAINTIKLASKVNTMAFSPDGKTFLTNTNNGARLWNLNGDSLKEFEGHSDNVLTVAFSPDGKTIVTGSADGTARLWNLNGLPLEVFKNTNQVTSVAFSPDGREVITNSAEGTVYRWDVLPVSGVNKPKVYKDTIFIPALKDEIEWKDLNSKDYKTTKFKTTEVINAFDIYNLTPDRKKMIFTINHQAYYLWDLYGKAPPVELKSFTTNPPAGAFSRDSRYYAEGTLDGVLYVWDMNTGGIPKEFRGHTALIKGISFSPDGKMILTASGDRTARLWDTSGRVLVEFQHPNEVTAPDFFPDGKTIVTGCYDLKVRLWDLQGKMLQEFEEPEGKIWGGFSFSQDSKRILTRYGRLWDVQGNLIKKFNCPVHYKDGDANSVIVTSDNTHYWNNPLSLEEFIKVEKMAAKKPD